MSSTLIVIVGMLGLCGGLFGVIAALPSRRAVAPERRRPQASLTPSSALSKLTDSAVGAINRSLRGRDFKLVPTGKLEQAGLRISRGDFLFMGASAVALGAIVGFFLGGMGTAILGLILVPIGLLLWLNLRISRRQAKFAQQLPDTLQMLAGSMRAGHSLLRALDGGAEEAEAPMSEELRRVINEARIGKDLVQSLIEAAARMKSQDFLWSAQAIETQREVGGNLAEILDNVYDTIQDRAQLNRQVSALSAEGKMSAWILISLPIGFLIVLSFINPTYASVFYSSLPGWIMLAVGAVLLTVGAVWLMKLIKPKY
ncbi:type II secretion system F family protein [Sinomonas humi]|uniref:Type II secretion system protein GspF domain-containing protein n=1 Tax=Sinomonas humi TaxID=1338436 RepID=A0A0B2AT75_9MICC|nr:type II secretion system F family protein [Sinomonas humi]KHL05044.1 hypothetical protein LK10_03595 [Sinomonas humi]